MSGQNWTARGRPTEADDFDLASVTTKEDLQVHLRRLHALKGKPSVREMARRTGGKYSSSSLHDYLKGHRYPNRDGLYYFVIACGESEAVAEQWGATWGLVEARNLRPPAVAASDEPDLSIRLKHLLDRYDMKFHSAPAHILRGDRKSLDADALGNVLAILETFIAGGGVVEAVTRFHRHGVRVTSIADFLAVLAADMVLHPAKQDPGSRLWLIEQSQKILKTKNQARKTQLRMTWVALLDLLRRASCETRTAWPIEQMVEDIVKKADNSASRFSSVTGLLFEVVRDDQVLREKLHRALGDEERKLTDEATPQMRHHFGRLRSLTRTYHRSDGYDFVGRLKSVPGGDLCDYPFAAAAYPLTMGDAVRLLDGLELAEGRASYPYVIELERPAPEEALTETLTRLLVQCNKKAYQSGKMWALPTAAEWITLAGCEDRLFPWGSEPADPLRANLTYSREEEGRLQPVGTLPGGRSRHGIDDCCGNVHEIVEWCREPSRRAEYRLAGESFKSLAGHASCLRLRHLTQSSFSRGNVGVRLVQIDIEDAEKRWVAQEAFRRTSEEPLPEIDGEEVAGFQRVDDGGESLEPSASGQRDPGRRP
ncbi:SUMF1/EgtB/PvdO family nonheme iron enzyme [Sphaerisporangium sp. NPDC004334]